MKRYSWLIFFILCASPVWCDDVEWGTVTIGKPQTVLGVSGKIIPQEGALSIESARVQGRIVSILKREGETVNEGDPLFNINSAECLSLHEEKKNAETRGVRELIDATQRREEQLGMKVFDGTCQILATHAGTLMRRQVELGSAFNIGDPLATILDISHLTVELEIPERDLPQVKLGQSVNVRLPGAANQNFRSIIQHILPTIDPVTRTGKVRLANLALPHGTTLDSLVFADVETGNDQRVLKVPAQAVVFHHNRRYVVKKNGSQSVPVSVEVLNESDHFSSVKPSYDDNLKAGDQIAIKGAIFLLQTESGSLQ